MQSKPSLRKEMREQRAALSTELQHSAARAMVDRVASLPVFQQARRIACYLAFNNEIDPHDLIKIAWQQGKDVYLPVLDKGDKDTMDFHYYSAVNSLRTNRYGILEPNPATAERIDANELDLMVLPLVAFDKECHRLGMGAGFYDRTLAKLSSNRPFLIGVGYQFQQVEVIPTDQWDINLDSIVTEDEVFTRP